MFEKDEKFYELCKKLEIKPTDEEIDFIYSNPDMKAADVAEILGKSINRIYRIRRVVIRKGLNEKFELNEKQKQIILSGILGDGNLKRNGSNYYYRETHAIKEKEYCKMKHDILSPFISKGGFHLTDKRDGQWGFQTRNSPTLKEYKKMTLIEVIDRLDKFGLIIYLLDDGWKRDAGWNLSVAALSQEEIDAVIEKYNKEFGTTCSEISYKTVSFRSSDMPLILPYMKKYIDNDIDIYKNKIKDLIDKFKV